MSLDTSYENVDVVHGYVDVEVKILKLMIVLLLRVQTKMETFSKRFHMQAHWDLCCMYG